MNSPRLDVTGLEIKEVSTLAADVVGLTLVHPQGADLPAWSPGAHVDVVLPSGLVRSYSLCGDPDDRSCYRIAVLRVADGRGGSQELHRIAGARQGSDGRVVLPVGTPRNHFALVPAEEYLFLAGGIGITPLFPMVRQAATAGRRWRLLYGARTRERMAFLDELTAYPGGTVDVYPQDDRGLPPLRELIAGAGPQTQVYACGPSGFLDLVQEAAREAGLAERLHVERFTAAETRHDGTERGFTVELARSGLTVEIGDDESILERVLTLIPGHPWSCREGTCGSCETPVLAGEVEHRDQILDDDERAANDTMFICVSRSRGDRLVLDL